MPDVLEDYGMFARHQITVDKAEGFGVGDMVAGMKSGQGMVLLLDGSRIGVQSTTAAPFVEKDTLVSPNGVATIVGLADHPPWPPMTWAAPEAGR